jgi:hypothetical protein
MTAKKKRVVYIAGYGRSGTTMLSMALGQHPALFGAGEVVTLALHAWRNNEVCSCGAPVQDCSFWAKVVELWQKDQSPSFIEDYRNLQNRIESTISPARMLNMAYGHEAFLAYARHTARLFDAIASVSGCTTIIDSSKSAGRALAFAQMPEIELYVVHMIRDGRGVAWSLLQAHHRDVRAGIQEPLTPKPILRTAARWGFVNLATEFLCWRLGPERSIRVRYEDFTSKPTVIMQDIGRMLGTDLTAIGEALRDGAAIAPGHLIAGNRLRMKGALRLVQDSTWRADMPGHKQTAFRWLCGGLLRRYGYS